MARAVSRAPVRPAAAAALVLLALGACGEREPLKERFVQNTRGWVKMERLHAAAAAGETAAVRVLLGSVHVDARDVNDETPLMTAVRHRRLPVVEVLIEAGADVDAASFMKLTPLMFAARTGDQAIVQRLLAASAEVDALGERDFTALTHAAVKGHLGVAAELLRAGADPAGGRPGGASSPRAFAKQGGYRDLVELLDEALAQRPTRRAAAGPKPGASTAAEPRRAGPAPVYANVAERERDLLRAAAGGDNWRLEEILSEPDFTNLDHRDEEGRTALMLAARRGQSTIVEMLLEAGASVDLTRGFYGETALRLAADKGHLEIVRALLAARADPNLGTPLLLTADSGLRNEISLALIEAGAYVNVMDRDGITPLRKASARCDPELTEAILNAGASLDDPDSTFGRTSFEFLLLHKDRGKCKEVHRLFIAAGAVEPPD